MIFDENAPKASQFQKPIFGKKTLLRNADGTRTGLSSVISGGLGWMAGLSPLGSKFGQQLDNLIQGGNQPSYLMNQDWYAGNVRQAEGKANSISQVTGGLADTTKSIALQAFGAGGGFPIKQTEDPNMSFRDMLGQRGAASTPTQRSIAERDIKNQMSMLPGFDVDFRNTEFYSDSPILRPNYFKDK